MTSSKRARDHVALAAIIIGFAAALSWPALAQPQPAGPIAPGGPAPWTDVAAAYDLPTEARFPSPVADLVRDPATPPLLIRSELR